MSREQTALDRFLAAVPYAVAALALLSLLVWQAAIRKTPTIFGDELEWTQISRAIAATGHAARRGEPIGFKSAYPYVIAPFWWIHSTSSAYTAIKYWNTVLMVLSAVPTYLLARLVVPARAAVLAALASLCTTALYYAPFLLPEVVAYPMFTLCAWLAVRALARPGARAIALAAVASIAAPFVRGELIVVPAAFAAALAITWLGGEQGSRLRRRLGVAGQIAAALVLVGLFLAVNQLFGHHSQQWATVTSHWRDRMWTLGFEATAALAIGLGLLPLVGGLASLWLPDRRRDPAWRAFAAFAAAAIVTTWTYTAVKAAYLSTVFATRVEERNLIYLQPLLLVGTAVWITARRRFLPGSLAALALTAWLVLHYGYQLDYPYFEAPGYGIAAMANRAFRWDQHTIRIALAACCGVILVAILVAHFGRRAARPVLVAVAAASLAMMLAGEITSSRGAARQSVLYATNMNHPLDWVDLATQRRGVTFIGQDISSGDALGINLTEFWNRSLKHVWSLDGSAPGPGPTLTPDLKTRRGVLSSFPDAPFVLETDRIDLVGKVVSRKPGVTLLRVPGVLALRQASYGVTSDGWIAGSSDDPVARGTYAYFGPETTPGTLSVTTGRTGFCSNAAPSPHVVVRVGPLQLNEQNAPIVPRPTWTRRYVVKNCTSRTLTFRIAPPVAVTVSATPLVHPVDYNVGDSRYLGVQVGFSFAPR